jgi:hypothetical protein
MICSRMARRVEASTVGLTVYRVAKIKESWWRGSGEFEAAERTVGFNVARRAILLNHMECDSFR